MPWIRAPAFAGGRLCAGMTASGAQVRLRHSRGSGNPRSKLLPRRRGGPPPWNGSVGMMASALAPSFPRSLSRQMRGVGIHQPIRDPQSAARRAKWARLGGGRASGLESGRIGGCCSMVEPQLPKLMTGVRFPSPAPEALLRTRRGARPSRGAGAFPPIKAHRRSPACAGPMLSPTIDPAPTTTRRSAAANRGAPGNARGDR